MVDADAVEYVADYGMAAQEATPPSDYTLVQEAITATSTTTAAVETAASWGADLGRRGVVELRANPTRWMASHTGRW